MVVSIEIVCLEKEQNAGPVKVHCIPFWTAACDAVGATAKVHR
jgi:hypothetical protein